MENKKAGVWIKQKSKSIISNELSRFCMSGEKRVQDLCMQAELTVGNCCGVGRFWWARRNTLGLAGLCRISLSAFTVPATFPGTKVVNLILRGNMNKAVHPYLECFQRCCLGGKQEVVEDFPTTCKRDFAVTEMASCSGMSEAL